MKERIMVTTKIVLGGLVSAALLLQGAANYKVVGRYPIPGGWQLALPRSRQCLALGINFPSVSTWTSDFFPAVLTRASYFSTLPPLLTDSTFNICPRPAPSFIPF